MEHVGIGFCQASCIRFLIHESTTVEPHRTGSGVQLQITDTFYLLFICTSSPKLIGNVEGHLPRISFKNYFPEMCYK